MSRVFFIFLFLGCISVPLKASNVTSLNSVEVYAPALKKLHAVPGLADSVGVVKNGQVIKKFGPFSDLRTYRNDPSFNYKEAAPEMTWLDRVMEWIFRHFFNTTYKIGGNPIFWRVFQGICIVVVLFVVYKILKLEKLGLFKKKDIPSNHGFNGNEQDFKDADFHTAIKEAFAAGDYRNAIRLWYMQILRDLSDRHIIDWSIEKTNSNYLNEMRTSEHYDSFARLTYCFDYTYYGRFEIPMETYQVIESDFENFVTALTK